MVLMHTLFPDPVDPAMSRWGILVRSATTTWPEMSFPRPMHSLPLAFFTSGQSTMDRKETGSEVLEGTSMPMAAFPGMGSIRTLDTASFRAMSSDRFWILFTFTPGAGSSSYRVTEGPLVTFTRVAFTPKSWRVCSMVLPWVSISAWKFFLFTGLSRFSRSRGGNS